MPGYLNDVKFSAGAAGSGDFAIGPVKPGFQSPSAAGAVDGVQYSYSARNATQFESGLGIYHSALGTIERFQVEDTSAGFGNKVSFTTIPTVSLIVLKRDLVPALYFSGAGTSWVEGTSTGTVLGGVSVQQLGRTQSGYAFSVSAQSNANTFALNSSTGIVTIGSAGLDFDTNPIPSFTPSATNGVDTPLTLVATVNVLDVPAPVVQVLPSISGGTDEGDLLTGTDGTYSPAATSIEYRWMRATTSMGVPIGTAGAWVGSAIGGATSANYTTVSADDGEFIFRDERPSNGSEVGSWISSSNYIGPVVSVAWTPAAAFDHAWEPDQGVTEVAGRVSAWVDYIGSVSLAQATAGNKPLYSATGFNTSFPGITFSQARTDNLANAAFTLASSTFSIFVLLDIYGNGASAYYETPSLLIEGGNTPNSRVNTYSSGQRGAEVNWDAPIPDAMLYGTIGDGANAQSYKDGVAFSSSSAFSATIGSSPNILTIGGPGVFFDGIIAGVFIKAGAISPTNIANLVTYINGKYGTAF